MLLNWYSEYGTSFWKNLENKTNIFQVGKMVILGIFWLCFRILKTPVEEQKQVETSFVKLGTDIFTVNVLVGNLGDFNETSRASS